jgi:hypothetical protein
VDDSDGGYLMILAVRGKDFDIGFVNNYCHEKYSELASLALDLQDTKDLTDARKKVEAGDADGAQKALRDIDKKRVEITQRIVKLREEILRELVESNGIEFDAEWWKHKASVNDINDFIYESIMKDTEKSTVVKKK